MSQWQEEKAKAAVQSMFRVRAAESPPDATGVKSVWHQGAKGADLLSWVDARGVVNEQALTLLDDHLLWTKAGLRTGVVGGARTVGKSSDAITFDRAPSRERIERAARALATYVGEDKYILHIASVVKLAVRGLEMDDEDGQVTNVVTAETVPPSVPRGRGSSKGITLGIAAALLVLLLAIAAYVLAT